MPKNYCIMQIWAESGKSALPICNYSQILYQFLTFTQNLKRSQHLRYAYRRCFIFSILVIFFLSPLNASASSTSSFLFFLSCHDLDDRFIRLTHSLLCKLSNITDRVFYTFFYKSVSAIELLSIFLHLKSQKPCFYS